MRLSNKKVRVSFLSEPQIPEGFSRLLDKVEKGEPLSPEEKVEYDQYAEDWHDSQREWFPPAGS